MAEVVVLEFSSPNAVNIYNSVNEIIGGPDQGAQPAMGHRQAALSQRPFWPVALGQSVGYHCRTVHATPSPAPGFFWAGKRARRDADRLGVAQARAEKGVDALRAQALTDGGTDSFVEAPAQRHESGGRRPFRPAQDERAQPGSSFDQSLELEFAVGLEHCVGVDAQLADDFLDRGQLVAGIQQSQPESVTTWLATWI